MKQNTLLAQVKKRKYALACAVSAASLLLLSGCSTPSDYDMEAVKSADDLSHAEIVKDIQSINWPGDVWWQRYQDTQLNKLMDEAFANSPSIQIAGARLKAAAGIAEQVGAIQKIQVGASASASMTKLSEKYQAYIIDGVNDGWHDYGSVGLDFSYDFDFWGKNHASLAAATSDYAASEAEYAASRLMLSTSIANAYAELARLYANQETVEAALKVRRKTTELLTKRYENGLETKGAVSQAKAAASAVEAELLGIQESVQLQKNALAALVGKGPDRGMTITKPSVVLDSEFGLPDDLGIGLLGHRPDITAARWRAESAANRIGVARAQFYPDVKISAFLGLQSLGIDNLFESGNDAASIGPALYLPIFSGGRLDGQLTSAEANYEIAVNSYNATLTEALHQVADVVTSTKALDAQIEKTQQSVDAAKEAHQIASNRYKGGLATYLDVLSAENALLNSERSLVNLKSRAFSLDLALVHALGGGYQSDNQQ